MKINIICQYYPPEIGAPQARLSEMAREWVTQGSDVTVLTGFPNHPTGVIPEQYKGRIFMEEVVDGVRIWRHWLYATPNKGLFKKTLAHLSFMTTVLLLSLFRGERADLLIVSSPSFFAVLSTYLMSRVRRIPYIFEVRDLWPGIFIELGVLKNRFLIWLLEAVELFLYRRAAAVVPVTYGFAEVMLARGIDRDKIEVITNGVDLDAYRPGPGEESLRDEAGISKDKFLILYIGAHGISHGLDKVLEAAEELHSDKDVHFLFVGDGAVKAVLVALSRTKGLKNVTFLPGQPRQRVAGFYNIADICLVPLRNVPGLKIFIPSKIFEIMACAIPIIASLDGEPAQILRDSGAALVVPPEAPVELATAIRALKNDPEKCLEMGRNGRRFVEKNYDRKMLAEKYLALIERVGSKGSQSGEGA